MRTIEMNLYDYEELSEKSKERARLALLEDQDFKNDILRRLNSRACEDIQNCVKVNLQRAFRKFTAIHWNYNLVSISTEISIDSYKLLRELANEAGYKNLTFFIENVSIPISTDSLIVPKFDDSALTRISCWAFEIIENVRQKSEKRMRLWTSEDGIQAYCKLYHLEFYENGKIFDKEVDYSF